jgi:hypothetical protein
MRLQDEIARVLGRWKENKGSFSRGMIEGSMSRRLHLSISSPPLRSFFSHSSYSSSPTFLKAENSFTFPFHQRSVSKKNISATAFRYRRRSAPRPLKFSKTAKMSSIGGGVAASTAGLYGALVTNPTQIGAKPEEADELKHHLQNGKGFKNPWDSFQDIVVWRFLWNMFW